MFIGEVFPIKPVYEEKYIEHDYFDQSICRSLPENPEKNNVIVPPWCTALYGSPVDETQMAFDYHEMVLFHWNSTSVLGLSTW